MIEIVRLWYRSHTVGADSGLTAKRQAHDPAAEAMRTNALFGAVPAGSEEGPEAPYCGVGGVGVGDGGVGDDAI